MLKKKSMRALVVLTHSECKRLIARGIKKHPEVQEALKKGRIFVSRGSTTAYVLEELLGEPIEKRHYVAGQMTGDKKTLYRFGSLKAEKRLKEVVIDKGVKRVVDDFKEALLSRAGLALLVQGEMGLTDEFAVDKKFQVGYAAAGIGVAHIQYHLVPNGAALHKALHGSGQFHRNVWHLNLKVGQDLDRLVGGLIFLTGRIGSHGAKFQGFVDKSWRNFHGQLIGRLPADTDIGAVHQEPDFRHTDIIGGFGRKGEGGARLDLGRQVERDGRNGVRCHYRNGGADVGLVF